MMRFFYKILASVLACLVLSSTVSFAVNMHYCGKHLVDINLMNPADSCGMEMSMPTENESCSIEKPNCCNDKKIVVDGQDELTSPMPSNDLLQQVFITSFCITYQHLSIEEGQTPPPFTHYHPPELTKDIPVLHEVFLI